jgi:hypothetical protein
MNRRDPDALVLKRAVAVQNRLDRERYRTVAPLRAEVTYDSEKTIPYGDLAAPRGGPSPWVKNGANSGVVVGSVSVDRQGTRPLRLPVSSVCTDRHRV